MDAALLTPSKYVKAIDFQGIARTFTITGIKIEELVREDNSTEKKGTISFAETHKAWILNVTNVKCLVALFGRETDAWKGKRVVLWPEPNDMSESGFAIRVKGSPDIPADVTFVLKLARKKPKQVTLKAYGKNGNGRGKKPESETEPPRESEPDEPPSSTEAEQEEFDRGWGPPATP